MRSTYFYTVIGVSFILCAFVGAVVPGLNYHVFFGSDRGALEWHEEQAEKIRARTQQPKEPAP